MALTDIVYQEPKGFILGTTNFATAIPAAVMFVTAYGFFVRIPNKGIIRIF